MLRAFLVAEVRAALARLGERDLAALDIPVQGESAGPIDDHLDRVWPSLTPAGVPRRPAVVRAASCWARGRGTLAESELDLLALPGDARVGTWQWSVDDVPLLDAADALLNGVAGHLRAHRRRRGPGPVSPAAASRSGAGRAPAR